MSTQSLDLVVCGAAGRMGRRIIALATEDGRFRIAGAVEAPGHAAVGNDAGEVAGIGKLGVSIEADTTVAENPDIASLKLGPETVMLDFTNAEASLAHLQAAASAKAPIVVGSTGFTAKQRVEAERLARAMPTLMAPNMSVGVNVLLSLVEDAVRRLGPGFDCEVVEVHHGRKKDAPSGTALALAEAAARAAGLDPARALRGSREGMVGERPNGEVGVFGLRGGDAAGDHTVMLLGAGERIELVHRASSRDCLATGALRAAWWLRDKPAGLYSMRDVVLGRGR
jgi:4-hydroxy-tetrahydrodipicolinate reductase